MAEHEEKRTMKNKEGLDIIFSVGNYTTIPARVPKKSYHDDHYFRPWQDINATKKSELTFWSVVFASIFFMQSTRKI